MKTTIAKIKDTKTIGAITIYNGNIYNATKREFSGADIHLAPDKELFKIASSTRTETHGVSHVSSWYKTTLPEDEVELQIVSEHDTTVLYDMISNTVRSSPVIDKVVVSSLGLDREGVDVTVRFPYWFIGEMCEFTANTHMDMLEILQLPKPKLLFIIMKGMVNSSRYHPYAVPEAYNKMYKLIKSDFLENHVTDKGGETSYSLNV